jgi:hypothetical protein
VSAPRKAFLLLAIAAANGCVTDPDPNLVVWDGRKGEELPHGVEVVIVHVTEDVSFDGDAAVAHQTYRWEESTLHVDTQALVLPASALLEERAQLTGRAHLRVEPFLDDPVLAPADDIVFELQFGSEERGWQVMPAPMGYRWRSVASVRVEPLGPFLVVAAEACRYEEVAEGKSPSRRCDFARRWEKVAHVGIRLIPFPAWPPRVMAKTEAQIAYGVELVNAEDGSSGGQ